MKRKQKLGYRFSKTSNNKAEEAVDVIFDNIPFYNLELLEYCLFNGSGIELRKNNMRTTFLKQLKYSKDLDNYLYGIFKIKIHKWMENVMVNVKYEPYYRSLTKEETVVQDVKVYTGIQIKFVFKDYEC